MKNKISLSRGKKKENHIQIVINAESKEVAEKLSMVLKKAAHVWSRNSSKEISWEVITIIRKNF